MEGSYIREDYMDNLRYRLAQLHPPIRRRTRIPFRHPPRRQQQRPPFQNVGGAAVLDTKGGGKKSKRKLRYKSISKYRKSTPTKKASRPYNRQRVNKLA